MRILYSSVGHWVPSGYGKVSKYIVFGLKEKGHEIFEISNQLTYGWLNLDGITVGARFNDPFAQDIIPFYWMLFKPDVLLTLVDVWIYTALPHEIKEKRIFWLPYTPVDAQLDETCEPVLKPLEVAYKIIAMSKFGEGELKKFFDNVVYIPHGVDTDIFRPLYKAGCKKEIGIPEDYFVFGHVAANYSTRKDFPHLYKAFRIFLDQLPESERKKVILYHHTTLSGQLGITYDILRLARKFGILKNFAYPTVDIRLRPTTELELAKIYNSFDVYVTASRGEGFGLPVLEAQACGVPVIAPANSSHVELVEGHGWLIHKFSGWNIPLHTPIQQIYPIVDEYALADAMRRAYEKEDERKKFGRLSEEFAKGYSWDKIIDMFDNLLNELADAIAIHSSLYDELW